MAMPKPEDDFQGYMENLAASAAEDQEMAGILERHRVSHVNYGRAKLDRRACGPELDISHGLVQFLVTLQRFGARRHGVVLRFVRFKLWLIAVHLFFLPLPT